MGATFKIKPGNQQHTFVKIIQKTFKKSEISIKKVAGLTGNQTRASRF